MTQPNHPILKDLEANGVTLPEGARVVENFDYQPGAFLSSGIEVEGNIPAILIQTREELFRAFSLLSVMSDREGVYDVHEGSGANPEEAKNNCLKNTANSMRQVLDAMDEHIQERRAMGEYE